MNNFQEHLQKAISEINKVSEIIVSSDKASQLDLDILLEKLRKTYNVVLSFDQKEEKIISKPPTIFYEENNVEKNEEVVIDTKTKEIFVEEELDKVIEKEEINEEVIIEQQKIETRAFVNEPEILFEPEIFEEKISDNNEVFEEKPKETPSVLKYLNEQMPKVNEISVVIEKKEDPIKPIEAIINKEEEEKREKVVEIQTINTEEKTEKTIGEKYGQEKSIFDNISNNVKQVDISSRFNSHNVDLRTAIGVNEKFMFINDLFSGNLRDYTDFIQKLNEADSFEIASQILNATKEEKRWVTNSLPFTTLHEIMIRKFH